MTEDEFTKKYPWIDPTPGYPDSSLREGITKWAGSPCIAVKIGGAHKSMAFSNAIHAEGLEQIDGHEWEIFSPSCENDEYVWGSWVLGLGLIHVMVPKEFTRALTDVEKQAWSGKRLGMYGSHTGNLSYTMDMPKL